MPTLAAITLHPTGGGAALVARLLQRVLEQRCGDLRLLTMFEGANHPATLGEKLRFAASLAASQVVRGTDWVLFSHLGLAQVQNALPSPLGRPYAVFLHGIEAWNPLPPSDLRALAQATVRISNSPYTATRVMAAHPSIGPVLPCPLALLPAAAVGPAADAGLDIGPHAVLVVGRMSASERYKGHDQLIDIWPRVVALVPDAQLVIAGSGDDAARLKEMAAASTAASHIVFTGFISDAELEALYTRAALFALPSRGEGFGLVYLEAMAHGLPCIGSIHDAATDVIVDGETGRLVSQDDSAAMTDAVAALLADEALRGRMGEAGRTRAQQEFSFDRFSERMWTLLTPLHGQARGQA